MNPLQQLMALYDLDGKHGLSDARLHQLYGELHPRLSSLEAVQLFDFAVQLWDGRLGREIAETILMHLAYYHPFAISGMQIKLIDRGIFFPGELYRKAPDDIVTALIDQLDSSKKIDHAHLLSALLWTTHPIAQHQYAKWIKSPPPWWNSQMHKYSLSAGWYLGANDSFEILYSETCYSFVPQTEPGRSRLFVPLGQSCPFCHQSLYSLFDLDLTDTRLMFLGLTGHRLRVIHCANCCQPYSTIYGEVDFEGSAAWSRFNTAPPFIKNEKLDYTNSLGLASIPRNPFESQWVLDWTGQTQVGGFPTESDNAFPNCPGCQTPMHFIGQVQYEDIILGSGLTSAYICATCQITATSYQQT